jgi:serine/threonine-protein kinase
MSGQSVGLREGDVLAGKYRIDRVLGAGGMGVVVAAHHLGLDTRVAIKLLLPAMLEQTDVVARFAREARAAAKIKSEHVARVFDVGALEDGSPYLVMEFLDGVDLQKWLQREGPLAVDQAVDFVLQACEAVAEAHSLGIVHRDLKPANLFCVMRSNVPTIKVLDFGISKMTGITGQSGQLAMTRTAALMGTPLYMSPEQMDSARDVDGRSDIWSLGVILFELVSGQVPFAGATLPEVCVKIATRPPPLICTIKPEVPEGIQAAILKCLEKERAQRFATVAELAAAIAPFATFTTSRSPSQVDRLVRTMQHPTTLAESQSHSTRVPNVRSRDDGRALGTGTLGAVGNTQAGRRWQGAAGRRALLGLGAAAVAIGALTAVFVASSGPEKSPAAKAVATASGAAPSPVLSGVRALPSPSSAGGPEADADLGPSETRLSPAATGAPRADGPTVDSRVPKAKARRPAGWPSPATTPPSKLGSSDQAPPLATTSRSPPASAESPSPTNAFDERL